MHVYPGLFPWVLGGPEGWFEHELAATLAFYDELVKARSRTAAIGRRSAGT